MKKIWKRIKEVIRHPSVILLNFDKLGLIRLNDELFIKMQYRLFFNKELNLRNPETFNEKIQWLKLNDRNPRYIELVDKYLAKEEVGKIIGKQYIIPTYGIYDSFDEINFKELPKQFVIKTTHFGGSHGVFIVRDKEKMDLNLIKKGINDTLKRNLYYYSREWPYKNVKPRIIVEKYLSEISSPLTRDYKFYCFNGNPKYLYVSEGLEDHSTGRIDFFDSDFKKAPFGRTDFMHFEGDLSRPKNYEKMLWISKKLSASIPFVRVDLYNIDGKIYFSELTFYPAAGLMEFSPSDWDKKLGDLLILPERRDEK